MSKLDMIMEAFDIRENSDDTSKKINDEEVEEKAEKMTDAVEVITETETENDSNTVETIGGDE